MAQVKVEPPKSAADEGILPRVIRRLIEQRKLVKNELKVEKDAKKL